MMPQAIDAWIQAADLSSQDLCHLTEEEAISYFYSVDWAAENDRLDELLAAGVAEACSPGVGFVADGGHILHLMPGRGETLYWLFDRPGSGVFSFDLFRSTTAAARGTMSDASELISMLFREAFVALWRRTMTGRVVE